jgi:hypothetical protein
LSSFKLPKIWMANGFLGPDVTATSWADVGVRKRGWGPLLGRPEGIRVPYEAADGAVAVLPRLEGGGLEVMVAFGERGHESYGYE